MLDRSAAQMPDRTPDSGASRRGRRERALLACALLAIVLHWAFLDGIDGGGRGAAEASLAPMSVRTIAAAAEPIAVVDEVLLSAPAPVAATVRPTRSPRSSRAPQAVVILPPASTEASASSPESRGEMGLHALAPAEPASGSAGPDASEAASVASAAEPPHAAAAGAESIAAASGSSGFLAAALPGAGDQAPPVYPTVLPPSATLRYEVRRGFLRGTARSVGSRPTTAIGSSSKRTSPG